MNLTQLIRQPELMDKETLYSLRGLVAQYPYYQTARLLLLQNLYLLHDASFDEELRRAAIYISDRKVLFNLVEAVHYKLKGSEKVQKPESVTEEKETSRTVTLIENFLESIPENHNQEEKTEKRKPTPADATVDYVAYLLETEEEEEEEKENGIPKMVGQSLIDDFISKEGGRIELKETPEYTPELENTQNGDTNTDDSGYFTETLAQIYIKQGKYNKALEIIKRLNLIYPKKSRYFADQIRFLEKLIINNKK